MSGLDCTAPVPRVNAELMGQYVGKRVKLVGRVEGAEGSTLRLRAPDETVVTVNMANPVPQVCCSPGVGPARRRTRRRCLRSHVPPPGCMPQFQCACLVHSVQSQYVEVEGVVNSAANMTEETCTPFGDNFGERLDCAQQQQRQRQRRKQQQLEARSGSM